ncbi:MAG: PilC/PilY family type IV pilus protein [Variovorax sp.]
MPMLTIVARHAPDPARRTARIAVAFGLLLLLAQLPRPAYALLPIGNNPLYLVSGKANVLLTLDNSNSMDEDASGAAVGSNNAVSKSEIARSLMRTLTDTYQGRINMGLMSYLQNAPGASNLHNSPYDASYDPAHYNPAWTGDRASQTNKRFRIPNATSAGDFIYYNVALPFYSGSNDGNAFCYSPTSVPFNNGENPASGPWDTYRCFQTKTGTNNQLPAWGNAGNEAAKGYSNFYFQAQLSPTDSDFAQGILDFGKRLTWNYVGPTWLGNDSPGRGHLDVPIAPLTAAQGTAIKAKLACNVPGNPAPCTTGGLKNAGLTPIEGTLLTAKDYFGGGWSNATEGYTAPCYPLPTSCGKDFVILLTDGLPSTDKNGGLVAVPATGLAAAAAAAATLKAAGIEVYIIGFALPYGTDPTSLDAIAAAGGTVAAYNAADQASLQAAFKSIFDDIFRKTSAFGSVSQNSTAINDGSRVYQGRFDSTDWSGELEAFKPLADGTLLSQWSTNDPGRIATPGVRKVFTNNPGIGGVDFKYLTDLSTAQQTSLKTVACGGSLSVAADCGQARIDWIRGDTTFEQNTGPLRKRTRVLGDVISSSPFYVADTHSLYVGANDGLLHAFDAANGNELFAYMPSAVLPNVYKLTQPNYSHEYFVDGELAVSARAETPGNRNILVGTPGRGGKAVFALDVTDPANFDATKVLWEFSDPDLGVSLGKPIIAKLNNGKTAALIGNGYNGGSERAVLFIIDIETGALLRKIDTQAGSSSASNGLTSPRGWDVDGNGTLDWVYAGDRLGNLWKFDLSASNPSTWASAFGTYATPLPFFVAKDSANNRQPITGGVSVGIDGRKGDLNFGKPFVFFGTGQYLLSSDVADHSVHSWYGLIDTGTPIPSRMVLKERTITTESTIAGSAVRAFSTAVAGDMVGMRGWYLDMVPPSGAVGERITTDSKFLGSVLLATSILPSSNACIPGGDGFINAVDPFTGGSLASPFFDADGNMNFNDGDTLLINAAQVPIGSISPNNNLPSEAILIGNRLITSGTSGRANSTGANNPIRIGRIAWREIVRGN